MALRSQILTDWQFAIGDTKECLAAVRPVRLPHTWSVEEEGRDIVGKGWYQTVLPADTCAMAIGRSCAFAVHPGIRKFS